MPSSEVQLLRAAATAADNAFGGTVVEAVGTGEGTRLVVAIDALGDARVTVTMPTRAAQRIGATVGAAVTVGIDPDTVHLIVDDGDGAARSTGTAGALR